MKINDSNGRISFLPYVNIQDSLAPGNYNLIFDQREGYYLTRKEDFKLPEKIYGDCNKLSDKYLNTFKSKSRSLGILLCGEKGSGKTLLAQSLCLKSNLPVIFITEPFSGPDFNDFIANITQEVVIFFDEYEKVYRSKNYTETQDTLLGILDGNFSCKKLFILTSNEEHISSYMTNRPSRIYYKKVYTGLEINELSEIVDYELINKDNKEELIKICTSIGKVNIDLVRSLIEEMNRYNETASEAVKNLNIDFEALEYSIEITNKKNEIVYTQSKYKCVIARQDANFDFYEKDEDGNNQYIEFSICPKDIISYTEDEVKYKNGDYTIKLTKIKKDKKDVFNLKY